MAISRRGFLFYRSAIVLWGILISWASSGWAGNQLNYREARQILFGELHLEYREGQYYIKDVYCSEYFGEGDFSDGKGPGPGLIPDHHILNVEHTWPQSRFSKKYPTNQQKTDLHGLFPAWNYVNSVRANLPFAEVDYVTNRPCDLSYRGFAAGEPEQEAFEPPDEHKGNVARALFYFSTRYELPIDDREEAFLRDWHVEDPVDLLEIDRAERIYEIQGTRNPFIDHPELVDTIEDF